jgi:hypothetical protein
MLARQTGSEECSPEYRVQPGQQCVPAAVDYDCEDLALRGIEDVDVVGTDVYRLDVDNDGVGCEAGAPRTATDLGDSVADIAPYGLPVVVLVIALVGSTALLRRAREAHRAAESEAERRANHFNLYVTLGLAMPLVLLGAFLLAILGFD